jgi:hypothetical protein
MVSQELWHILRPHRGGHKEDDNGKIRGKASGAIVIEVVETWSPYPFLGLTPPSRI